MKKSTEDLIWETKLDGLFDVRVTRDPQNPEKGVLTVSTGKDKLYSASVGLMYGAAFGPDVEDVALWQKMAVDFVDRDC